MIKKTAIFAFISTSILITLIRTGSAEKSYGKKIIWQIKPTTLKTLRLHFYYDYREGEFHEGMARLRTFSEEDRNLYDADRGRMVFIDTEGKILKTVKIYQAEDFHDGMAAVQLEKDGKWGFINKDGEHVIKPQFFSVENFSEGLACVQLEEDGKWGFINKDGKFVIKPKFKSGSSFHDGQASVKIHGLFGVKTIDINKEGETVEIGKNKIYEGYEFYTDFNNDLAGVRKDDKWGFIDKEGKIIIEPQYYAISHFNNGHCFVIDDGGKFMKFINKQNNTINSFKYDNYDWRFDYSEYSEINLARQWRPLQKWLLIRKIDKDFRSNKLYGFFNTETGFIIQPRFYNYYIDIDSLLFKEGLQPVQDSSENSSHCAWCYNWGFIDESGSFVIDPIFKTCRNFHEGLALVDTDEGCGYIKNPLTVKK